MYSPRLSPDGRYISAITFTGLQKNVQLMLFDTNSKHWSSLATGDGFGYNEWTRDGKYIYLRQFRDGAEEKLRVRMKDRVLEQVLSLKDFPQRSDISDINALWIGLTPDGSPLLMRDRSVQEIYALELQFH
jgi:hypothetical protein